MGTVAKMKYNSQTGNSYASVLEHFKIGQLEYPRTEIFICFFNRCADRMNVVSPACLYKAMFLTDDEIISTWQRVGRLLTFDARHICQETNNGLANLGNFYDLQLNLYEERRIIRYFIA